MGNKVFIRPKARLGTTLAATALLIAFLLTSVQADNSTGPSRPSHPDGSADNQQEIVNHVPGQLVVKFSSDSISSGVFGDRISGSVADYLEGSGVYLYEVASDADTYRLTDSVMEMSGIEYAHPNYTLNELHPVQGSYPFSDGIGSGSYESQPAVSTLDLASAHEIATGAGVTVAVIDGGIDYTHPALSGAALSGYDFVDGDNDAFDEPGGDNSGHGTFVAGIVHLAAPDATIKAYRVTDPDGAGDGFSLAKAIERAVLDGCDVINLSVVLMHEHLAVRDAVEFALSHNVAVVAAAGNEGSAMFTYPAANAGVIAVAAIDSVNRLADFSSYGAFVDVCAPGTRVYSAYVEDGFAWWSGTSFATPFAAGQMALLREKFSALSVALLGNAIKGAATDIDDVNPGHIGDLGGGLVNPVAAFDALSSSHMAAIIPDTLFFTLAPWEIQTLIHTQTAVITSTNAPADFVGVVIDTDYVPITTTDSVVGVTNDSITLTLNDTCYTYQAGTYYNRFMFDVADVPAPVMLVVELKVVDSIHSDWANISPVRLDFQAPVGAESVMSGGVWLTSSNQPADYTASVQPGGAQITSLVESSGATPDSVLVTVDPSLVNTPGFYYDTVTIEVDGIPYPVYLPVVLELTDTSAVGDTAWVLQDSLPSFVITEGSDVTFQDAILVFSTNAPAYYYVDYPGGLKFTTIISIDSLTNGWTYFQVHAPHLSAGVYQDTLLFYVERVSNNPVPAIITLEVDSIGGPTVDYASVWPQTQYFVAKWGEEKAQLGSVFLSSTNAPAAFSVTIFDEPDFVNLLDPTGMTDDSAYFEVLNTAIMPVGSYCDTLAISVEGCDNSPLYAVVYLSIDSASSPGQETATVDPNVLDLYVPHGAIFNEYRKVWLTSTNAPAGFVGVVLSGVSGFVALPDSAGMTDDSVTIVIDPSGLDVATYHDSIIFFVDGVDNPVLLNVNLTIIPPDSMISLSNYPNPFNPGTNIALSLHRASHVKLDVFNILGRHVTTLLDRPLPAGEHTVYWEGTDSYGRAVASGTYFYRLRTDDRTLTRKMVLLK